MPIKQTMFEQINEIILPNALMIGVDYDLFWTLNPKSLKPFVRAFELKREQEDLVCWKIGGYIRIAVASIMNKNVKYPTSPFLSTKNKKEKSQEEIQNEIKEIMLVKMAVLNSRFKKGV